MLTKGNEKFSLYLVINLFIKLKKYKLMMMMDLKKFEEIGRVIIRKKRSKTNDF